MKPYYADDWLTVYEGDCRDVMAEMEAESIQTVVTSPPYWGLRDYGIPATIWGGDSEHAHEWQAPEITRETNYGGKTRWQHINNGRGEFQESRADRAGWMREQIAHGARCDCGAWCGALGLERTPEEYVDHLVEVFRAVWRVLRPDGTLWLNLGDCYASQATNTDAGGSFQAERPAYRAGRPDRRGVATGLKPKDMVGIPWRAAFALQADGWYLRSDIIWHKPQPMPESVTDRPTKAHEYLFLLSKSERYYYDAAAIREPISPNTHARMSQVAAQRGSNRANGGAKTNGPMRAVLRKPGVNPKAKQDARRQIGGGDRMTGFNDRWRVKQNESFAAAIAGPVTDRNARSVWTIPTEPYRGAHFATFPRRLVEPCVMAGAPEGGVVLDPFAGTGTVGLVAQARRRPAVMIELNPDYLRQCLARASRLFGVGGRVLEDRPSDPPEDSLWRLAGEQQA